MNYKIVSINLFQIDAFEYLLKNVVLNCGSKSHAQLFIKSTFWWNIKSFLGHCTCVDQGALISGNAGVWVQTHTIYYRPLREETTANKASTSGSGHSSRKGKGSSSKSVARRKGDLWNGNNGNKTPKYYPLIFNFFHKIFLWQNHKLHWFILTKKNHIELFQFIIDCRNSIFVLGNIIRLVFLCFEF